LKALTFQGALCTNLGLATLDMPCHVANTNDVLDQPCNVCKVGAGLSGAMIAKCYASILQQSVLIIKKCNHIGGNYHDYMDEETGIWMSKFGAHLFHTTSHLIWDYIHRFAHWTKYEHTVLGFVKNKHVPIPVNINTVNALFQLNISSKDEMKKWLEKKLTKYSHEPCNSEEMVKVTSQTMLL
jgi:UDP-galactopyranose mutase